MATAQQALTELKPNPLMVQFRSELQLMEAQFKAALPPHIPVDRFMRVVATAVQNNPKLLTCTRQSLFNACMKCAQDGLLPDGREAALVPYGEGEDGGRSADNAQYLPMVAGIRKKVRNSGALTDWNVQVVQEGDEFDHQLGDEPFINHKRSPNGGRTRKVLWAYSIAIFPDGTKSREIMNVDEIEDIRKKSRAKRGPWSDPVFYPEMCRKTVAKLHSKQLPMSTDLDRLLHEDDELYDFHGAREEAKKVERPGSAAATLDWFAAGDEKRKAQPERNEGGESDPDSYDPNPATTKHPAYSTTTTPRTVPEYLAYARAIMIASPTAEELRDWFASEPQRKLRNGCGLTKEEFEKLAAEIEARCEELEVT